ncbi:MAG: sugar ABC transporter permease [Chloroflexi bacterium]|nr:sugar ABC transporter permease [Chloroflexota bacterium]
MTTISTTIRTSPERRLRIGTAALPYLLVLPTLVFVIVFTLWPTVRVFYDSLYVENPAVKTPLFTGIGNYDLLMDDYAFRDVLFNTFVYVIVTVPISVFLALILALVLNRKFRALGLYRLAFFYPTVLPMVSAATIWLFMYTPGYGLINVFIGMFGIPSQNWLGSANLALIALMILGIWKQTGYFMIFYLAGLQGLPHEIFEAADLDGASKIQSTRYLTIPLLMGTTLFVTTIAVVNAFSTVDQIYLMTGGGPVNSSSMLLFEIYKTLFSYLDVGKASAMSVILIVVLFVFSALNFYLTERRVTYE